MADPLQKLSDSFAELENAVKALDKQRTEFTQDNTTLEARNAYLANANSKLTETFDSNSQKYKGLLDEKAKKVEEVDDLIAGKQKELHDLEKKKPIIHSQLEAMIANNDEEVIKLMQVLNDKKAEISAAEKERLAIHAEWESLEDQVTDAKNELDEVRQEVKTARIDLTDDLQLLQADKLVVEKEVAEAKAKRDSVIDELEELEGNVVSAKQIIASADKKASDFLEYEKRAKKALQAREDALLDKEEQLSVTARRRNSVLDKL